MSFLSAIAKTAIQVGACAWIVSLTIQPKEDEADALMLLLLLLVLFHLILHRQESKEK